jgi:predicted RNA-binding protein YlxR (DUF448 family)
MKEQPMRTCLGCHKRFPKNQLMKFVVQQGILMHDSNRTGQGRSAYCCDNKNCLGVFFRQKKKMSRAFRVQEDQIRFELKDWE